jgi:hypothetical protein
MPSTLCKYAHTLPMQKQCLQTYWVLPCRFYVVQCPKRQGGKCRLLMTAKHRLPVGFMSACSDREHMCRTVNSTLQLFSSSKLQRY